MKIKKELKNATFEYDEETKSFTISGAHPTLRGVSNTVELNKVYAFAFMRFVVRMAQRNWFRQPNKFKKRVDKECDPMLQLNDINLMDHPEQTVMFRNESLEEK